MSRSLIGLQTCLMAPAFLLIGYASADEPVTRPASKVKYAAIRDSRPDESRGWVIVSKQSFWPLCYESLEKIEHARSLIGSGNVEEIADAYEKCGAWLQLAASATMTDGKSGVVSASDRFISVAQHLRSGNKDITDKQLDQLATLGLLCMAKSHLMRAEEPDVTFRSRPRQTARKVSTEPSGIVKAAEAEIASENVNQLVAQYRYDTIQSRQHLTVAQNYLAAAAQAGGFAIDESAQAEIPPVTAETPSQLVDYFETELRARIEKIGKLVEVERKQLSDALSKSLPVN